MNDNVAVFSFIGMGFTMACAMIGVSIVMRAVYRAVAVIWEKRYEIDDQVERDFKVRVR